MFDNLYLHDYEISDIKIQYTEARIQIKMKPPNSFEHYMKIVTIEDFVKLEFTCEGANGAVKYIRNAIMSYNEKKKIYKITLQLNSNDVLNVEFKRLPIIAAIPFCET